MRILIDADGCPVVDIAIKIAREFALECIIICDTSHVFEREGASTITVSKGADSVDFKLVNMLKSDDVAITQDYGLAAMCMARCATIISQDGMEYNGGNIEALLFQRHTNAKLRATGARQKGNLKRTEKQDLIFADKLREIIMAKLQA